MAGSIFVTGGTGFIGRRVLSKLAGRHELLALTRRPAAGAAGVRWVQGDVRDASSYRQYLSGSTTVIHLAAVTGKAAPADYETINVDGTRTLLEACRQGGVGRFIHVSSIAARYPDLRSYPYGASKRRAEALVTSEELAHVIVRPTVVLGEGSPVWQRFRQLAGLPVIPLIGNGQNHTQPIHVDDLAAAISWLVDHPSTAAVLEIGGPEAVTLAELLGRIRRLIGSRPPRFVRIPAAPVRVALRVLEPVARSLLPVTVGQLSLFTNDSTAQPSDELRALWPQMMSVDQMLKASEHGSA